MEEENSNTSFDMKVNKYGKYHQLVHDIYMLHIHYLFTVKDEKKPEL